MRKSTRIDKLAKKEERSIVRRIVLLSLVSLVLAGLLFTFGITALGKFADVLEIIFKSRTEETVQDQSFLSPLLDDDLPSATNEAEFVVRGFASNGKFVNIYLDEVSVVQTQIIENKFESDEITLKEGSNKIRAKAVGENSAESDFSGAKIIVFDNQEPRLEVETPIDDQYFSGANNRLRVSGKTDNDSQIFANGFLASVNFEGKFEVFVPVGEGETIIEIKAVDSAGNSKIEDRKIHYQK